MKKSLNDNNVIDVHLHIEKGFNVMKDFLPIDYLEKVKEKLKGSEISVTDDIIRNIRRRRQKPEKNLKVFNALVEVAVENRTDIQKLEKLLT